MKIGQNQLENPRVGGSNPPSSTIFQALKISAIKDQVSLGIHTMRKYLLRGALAIKKPEQRLLPRLLLPREFLDY